MTSRSLRAFGLGLVLALGAGCAVPEAPEARAAAGLVDGLLRLSIGIESVEDLQRDLDAGLKRARG